MSPDVRIGQRLGQMLGHAEVMLDNLLILRFYFHFLGGPRPIMMSTSLRHSPMICTAFDSCFQHVKKARHVILVHMSLVPQAGAPDLIPARAKAQPRRRRWINDRLVQAACECDHVPLDEPTQELGPGSSSIGSHRNGNRPT